MNSKRKNIATYIIVIILLSIVAIFIVDFIFAEAAKFNSGTFSYDIFLYWSSFRFLLSHGNPYDYSQLTAFEAQFSVSSTGPFYAPPWTFLFLAPIVIWPFKWAVLFLVILNFFIAGSISHYIFKYLSRARDCSVYAETLSWILYLPVLQVINFGQMSLVVTLSVYLSAYFLFLRKNDFFSGIILLLATLKIQMLFIILPISLLYAIKGKRYGFIYGFFGGLAGLCIVTEMVFPGVTSDWISSSKSALIWMPCSLLSPIRILFVKYGSGYAGGIINTLDYVVPSLGLVFCLIYLSRRNRISNLGKEFPFILTMTILFVPYCHIFDHSLLLLLHIVVIYAIFYIPKSQQRGLLFGGYAFFTIISFVLQFHYKVDDYRLFWQPIPLYILFMYAIKNLEPKSPEHLSSY